MPALKALAAQIAGLLFVLALGRSGALPPLSPFQLAVVQGVGAATVAIFLRADRWWVPLHLLFLPLVALATGSGLPAWLWLAGFASLALVYWTSFRTQVPLFLSNRATVHRLVLGLPDAPGLKVLDLGSGTGSFVCRLARLRPDWAVHGIEAAPIPWWLSRRAGRGLANAELRRGDFWQTRLGDYDLVYAFLSPVPMPALWSKAVREMRPGTWLVSNSFPVPGVQPQRVIAVGDRRDTHLYCYAMGGAKDPVPKGRQ